MKAIEVSSHTLIGVSDERPTDHGNCFDVKGDDGQYYRVLNFNHENLESLLDLGLTWPIEFEKLSSRCAVIMDGRIGERWYSQRYCEVCTPQSLLPITQRQRQLRDIARSIRTEGDDFIAFDMEKKGEFP